MARRLRASTRIAVTAAELGYSLDPVRCADACDNVLALATLELKKRALVRFALSRKDRWQGVPPGTDAPRCRGQPPTSR